MSNNDTRTVFSVFLEACEKYIDNTAYKYKVGAQEFQVTYKKFLEDVFILSKTFKKNME